MNRCAVIGCGWAGRHHMETAAHSEFAELAAVVDPDENKRRAASERYGIPAYRTLEELLASPTEFDTGIVATLPGLHAEQCRLLIAAGKHILCEKPVCRTSAEIAALKREAQQAGITFGVPCSTSGTVRRCAGPKR